MSNTIRCDSSALKSQNGTGALAEAPIVGGMVGKDAIMKNVVEGSTNSNK